MSESQNKIHKMVLPETQTEKKSQSGAAVHKVVVAAQQQAKTAPPQPKDK